MMKTFTEARESVSVLKFDGKLDIDNENDKVVDKLAFYPDHLSVSWRLWSAEFLLDCNWKKRFECPRKQSYDFCRRHDCKL